MLFVLALRIYQSTGSNAAVSGLFLTYGIPAVFFGLAAGAIVDHIDRRLILVYCDLTRSVTVLVFLVASQSIVFIYILAFVNAILNQFYVPAEAPTIPRLVTDTQLVAANSLFTFTYFSSLAFGAIFAGPILRWFGSHGAFLFVSMLFALAAYNNARVPSEGTMKKFSSGKHLPSLISIFNRVFDDVRAGVQYVRSSRILMDSLMLLTGTQIIIALLGTLGPGFADRMLEIDIRDSSLVIVGPMVAGIILGALWVGKNGSAIAPSRLIRTGITSSGLLLMLISLTVKLKSIVGFAWLFHNWIIIPLVLLLFFLLGVANSMLDVPANSILQKEAVGPMRGRVYGILTCAVGGVGILPIVISGVLADVLGVGKVILLLGLGISAYGLFRMRYNTI